MKKLLAIVLTAVMLFTLSSVAFAVDYDQIFDEGTLGSKTYRIPAIYTLNDGSVMAAADMRYNHGSDSPNNIETVVAVSANGYTGWNYSIVNYFDDYADGVTDKNSASFIDSAIVQSKETNRIYLLTDAWTSNGGYLAAKRGSGYTEIEGKKYMLLTTGNNTDDLSSFGYYIADFAGEYAPVLKVSDSSATAYSVDREYRLYKDGKALTMKQYGSDKTVQQNVFYGDAELCCYNTCYLWLRTSDDNGKTWSDPTIITPQIKSEKEGFLGICPGSGFVTEVNGKERIIFMVYDNLGAADVLWNEMENVSTVYSDDGGATWHRGAETTSQVAVGKTSESQMVALNNGVLRLYARNGSDYIAYADSTDGGVTWSKFVRDLDLGAMGNCMCSFINTSKTIDGKPVILGSFPSDQSARADGVIKTGVVNADNTVDWIATYHVNDGFFAYSCLTELADGNFAYLYEDVAAHIESAILTMDAEGNISEINGNNCEYEESLTFWQKIVKFFKDLLIKLQQWLGIA